MVTESRTIEIQTADGVEVATVSQLPATRAVRLLAKTGKILGPGIEKIGSALAQAKAGQVEALAPAIGGLLQGLDPDALEGFLLDLFAGVKLGTADLTKGLFDLKFRGQLDQVWKLAVFCLEVQFGNFFGDIVARAAPLAVAKPSATLPTSTPTSTG